jgi:hypothetical protein
MTSNASTGIAVGGWAAALERRGLEYPFPWPDLWQWYGILDRQPGGVRPLRAKIRELAAPVIEALERQRSGLSVTDPGSGPLTWADLDARLAGLSAELDGALSRDDLQDVGRRAREVLIDCAALLADPSLVPAGQVPPKAGDAKAWLGLFLTVRAPGGPREELRRLVCATWIWPRRSRTATSGASRPSPQRAGNRAGCPDASGARGRGHCARVVMAGPDQRTAATWP